MYYFEPSPTDDNSWVCLRRMGDNTHAVGSYTLFDVAEDEALTEKKLLNLAALLNGRSDTLPLGHMSDDVMYFQRLPERNGRERIMFRVLGEGEDITRENALFSFEKEVRYDTKSI